MGVRLVYYNFEKAFRTFAKLVDGRVDPNVSRLAGDIEELLKVVAAHAPDVKITVTDGQFTLTVSKNVVEVSTVDGSELSGVKILEFAKALPSLLEMYAEKLQELESEVRNSSEKLTKLAYGIETALKALE